MTQVNPSLYLKSYGSTTRSDGWYVERSTNDLVAFVDGTEVSRISASTGAETITLEEGYIFVGNATDVATPFDASTRGSLIAGNGTTIAALDANDAGKVVMGDGTDVVSQNLGGDVATVSSTGKVSLTDNFRLRTATSETTAGNTNYTLAKISGGILLRDPNGASRTDTVDSAVALVTGLNSPSAVGQFISVIVVNTADADETITLNAAAGVTLSPPTIEIGRGQSAHLLFRADNVTGGAQAMTCYLLDNRLSSGKILVGNANDMPIPRTIAGDVTLDNTGTSTIGGEKVHPLMLDRSGFVEFFDDFTGKALNTTTNWTVSDTSGGGTPVSAVVADAAGGVLNLQLDATDEVENLCLSWGDQRTILPANDPVAIFRLQVVGAAGIPAANTLTFGLASDRADDPDSIASNAMFRIDGTAAILNVLLESDDGAADVDDITPDTPLVLTHSTYYEFKIDATDPAAVLFYYRSALGGTWTALTKAATTFAIHATTTLQPFIQIQKTGGVGQPQVYVDYVQVSTTRT